MTRILVCGVVDDPSFVHDKLTEVNKIYGPISCIIHANHAAALAWQQSTSRGLQAVRQCPVTVNMRICDTPTRWADHSDRLLAAKPDYVVVFQTPGPRDAKIEKVVYRALRAGLIVLTYETEQLCRTRGRPAVKRLEAVAA